VLWFSPSIKLPYLYFGRLKLCSYGYGVECHF
jgi:hypothetical protein